MTATDGQLAVLAAAAYTDPPTWSAINLVTNAAAIGTIIDGQTIAAFRGTPHVDNARDLLFGDFFAFPNFDIEPRLGSVDVGFWLWSTQLDKVIPADVDVFCGHSLGGALAINVAAIRILAGRPFPKRIVTFNAPRAASAEMRALILGAGVQVKQYAYVGDIVNMVANWWHHVVDLTLVGSPGLTPLQAHAIALMVVALKAAPGGSRQVMKGTSPMATTSVIPPNAPAPASPTQAANLTTMLETVSSGLTVLQNVMPEIAAVGGFVPGATPIIQIVGLALGPVQNAIKFIMAETGKTPLEAFEEFLMHIGPGMPNSPTLSAAAPSA